ncbi:uncharacterized protein J8A68_005548 [[Candida] subhashii]|uniref:NAD-dependent epimerase/dehydratase domain-containing protein n=1 Tax=[Candida] subhashii TaxID=561895 RepID=A0A8J5UE68_9ASCO|nr:uncharacterized protein J8A68_005548 [[Candida] subhashii]KAG7660873.1 hypothetical protein J8A68_005548 [[Candida] subhashii]
MTSAITTTTTVFVSGANGFIAQHIVKQLLVKGYAVIGTVRTTSKGESLKELVKSDKFSYEVIPDLVSEGAFDQVLEKHPEATVFIHTASPVTFSATDVEKELLIPAVQGTKNVLAAISKHGPQIKRVVITSSIVAMLTWSPSSFDNERSHTEEDWNPITYEESKENSFVGYLGSKKFAELAAWEYIKENKSNFDISFVNPAYVFGPQAYAIKDKSQLNLSNEIINSIAKLGPNDEIPELAGTFIDVRDVAKAHIFAFESDRAIGKRLSLVEGKFSKEGIATLIHEKFPKSTVPKGDLTKEPEQFKKQVFNIDNSKTRELLGFDFVGLEQSIIDTAQQIYAAN